MQCCDLSCWNINIKMCYLIICVCCCRDGFVSLQEYMAFMISRETENVQSSQDVEAAFRALTSAEKQYITAQELYAVSVHVIHTLI